VAPAAANGNGRLCPVSDGEGVVALTTDKVVASNGVSGEVDADTTALGNDDGEGLADRKVVVATVAGLSAGELLGLPRMTALRPRFSLMSLARTCGGPEPDAAVPLTRDSNLQSNATSRH